jgi:cell division septation protein DedD
VARDEPAAKQPITDPVEPNRGENSTTAAVVKNIGAEPMAVKGVQNTATVPPAVKPAGEGAKPKRAEEISRREAVITPAPTVALPAQARPAEENIIAPVPSVAKPESRQTVVAPVLQPLAPARRETDIAKKATESSPVPAADSTARPVAKNPTPPEVKTAAAPAKEPAREEKDAEIIDRAGSPATPAAARPVMPTARIANSTEVKAPDATPVRSFPEKLTAGKPEAPKSTLGIAKSESQVTDVPPAKAPTTIALPEKNSEKVVPDQLALLKKPMEPIVERKPLARQAPKALEGFIIQIAFNDKNKAQNWAEQMEQRGYAVSVTEAGGGGSLRVRLGNFSMRDDAERQLRNFKQEGMSGIIINLPQAFRPEARSSAP